MILDVVLRFLKGTFLRKSLVKYEQSFRPKNSENNEHVQGVSKKLFDV